MKRLQLFIPLFLTAIFFFGTSAAQSGFMKLGDIKGESTDSKHRDWINIESFSQSIAKPAGSATGAARRRGAAVLEDIMVTKKLDMSSPRLTDYLVKGQVIPEVIIELVSPGRPPYYTITMSNVMISSFKSSGDCGNQCQVSEQLSLNYEKITWTYINARGEKVTSSYNVDKGM